MFKRTFLRTLAPRRIRGLSSLAKYTLPEFQGEPFLDYAPGSTERSRLVDALKEVKSEVIEVPCIVGGEEIFSGNTVQQVMPTDHGHVLCNTHLATEETIQKAIKVSQDAKAEWENMDFGDRAMIFRKAADLIATKWRPKLNAAVMLGTGKNVWQAEIDAAVETIDFLRLNPKMAEQIYAQQPPLNSNYTWNRSEYRPLEGFVLAVTPFNFCAIGANLPASPAMMGNTVLWKPATTAVLGNYYVYQILKEAGLPEGVISFLPSKGSTIGNATVSSPDFAGLHFTGSTATFNGLWNDISNNLDSYKSYPRIVGETGGKNFHFIHKSADLDHAVFNTIRGAFEFSGQKCSACSRAYVPKSIWPQFKEKLLEGVSQIKVGQSDDMSVFMTSVIDGAAFKDHVGYIEGARADPDCTIIAGGTYDNSKGYFVQPTVIECANPKSTTMVEEIFGPVLSVHVYEDATDEDYEAALKLCDETGSYALTGSVFARSKTAQLKASKLLRQAAGNFYMNDKSTGAIVGEQPFGGGRASGTNDKAGSPLNLLRWVTPRTIKETTNLLTGFKYPHME